MDELAREATRRMIEATLQLQVAEHIGKLRGKGDECGHALVVRSGRARERKVTLGAGTVKLLAPKVNDRPIHRIGQYLPTHI